MKVLYLSCYPDQTFRNMINSGRLFSQAAQKFNKLFVNGFCLNSIDVDVVSFVAANEASSDYEYTECVGANLIRYHYFELRGNVFNKQRQKETYAKNFIDSWCGDNPYGCVVVDALKPATLEFLKYAKKYGIKTFAIITDFVDFLGKPNQSFAEKIKNKIIKYKFYKQFEYTDVFVILTKEMLNKIDIKNCDYVVIDGICQKPDCITQNIDYNADKIIFLYSGAISNQFGLGNLVNGFLMANIPNSELHIYGAGDYVTQLEQICKENSCVKYLGTVINEEMVKLQRKATFLVNPRPVGDEYTKYSFPSKNIEYMCSGRPLITTKLPCLTQDYYQHIFLFEDDTADGIAKSLQKYSIIPNEELTRKGRNAREFIYEQKNNVLQTKKLIDLM